MTLFLLIILLYDLIQTLVLKAVLITCQISKMEYFGKIGNPLSANPTKWSNTLKQFIGLKAIDYFRKAPLLRCLTGF